jgi:tRNA threonylcarbamoyladenosine biosynthesis protein TsaB
VALYDGIQVLYESTWKSTGYHTVELAPTVEDALHRASLTPVEVGALGVALGPGSFTGLRIGVAFVKGMALVRHLPLVGIHTLDILAAAQPILEISLIALLRAGRGRMAVGWYEVKNKSWQSARDIEICTLQELAQKIIQPTYICGELSEEERGFLRQSCPNAVLASPAHALRRPGYLAEISWKRWKSGRTDDPAVIAPVYLHYNDPVPG